MLRVWGCGCPGRGVRLRHRHQRGRRDPHQLPRRRGRRARAAASRSVFDDGTAKPAEVVGTDPLTDLAIIKAEDASRTHPGAAGPLGHLDVGEQVVAIGSPFGLEATVTSGIVSALHRPVSVGGQGGSGDHLPRDPDRRRDQPGQLRRPAGEHAGRGRRHQLLDPYGASSSRTPEAPSASASRSRSTRCSRSSTSSATARRPRTPASGSRCRTSRSTTSCSAARASPRSRWIGGRRGRTRGVATWWSRSTTSRSPTLLAGRHDPRPPARRHGHADRRTRRRAAAARSDTRQRRGGAGLMT